MSQTQAPSFKKLHSLDALHCEGARQAVKVLKLRDYQRQQLLHWALIGELLTTQRVIDRFIAEGWAVRRVSGYKPTDTGRAAWDALFYFYAMAEGSTAYMPLLQIRGELI